MREKKGLLLNSISLVIVVIIAIFVAVIFYRFATHFGITEIGGILLHGAVGSKHTITECLVIATPLILAGLGVTFAFQGRLWNIGAEGQLYMGAIAATFIALNLSAPAPLHMLLIIIGSFLAGGAWAAIAGVFKAKLGVNEILTSIMLNFTAIWIVHYLIYGPWRDLSLSRPQTSFFPASACLPIIIPGSRLHAGLLLGIACAILTYVVFKYTRLGYAIKMLGANPKAAQYGGINVSRAIIITMFISGGLAGLAGMGLVCGLYHYLIDAAYQISPGYGYYAIGVALLGGLSAWGTFLASIFFGFLMGAASYLKAMAGMHAESLFVIVGLILLAVLARGIFIGQLKRLPGLRGRE